jgi:hypothetical protein
MNIPPQEIYIEADGRSYCEDMGLDWSIILKGIRKEMFSLGVD